MRLYLGIPLFLSVYCHTIFFKKSNLYLKIQEEDYEAVIDCLSNHIPKIYDESLSSENEIVFMKSNGKYIYNSKKTNQTTIQSGPQLKRQPTIDGIA